jgi:hypothetical protein
MMAVTTGAMVSSVKRLISVQAVLTALGLVTGIAVIFLPFGSIFLKPFVVWEIGVTDSLAEVAAIRYESSLEFFLGLLMFMPPLVPLLLAVPISAGYLRWLTTGGLAPWAWRTDYTLAVLTGAAVVSWFGWIVFLGMLSYAKQALAPICILASLGLGGWVVMRNRRAGLPHALNALIALQVVYVADALGLLVIFIPDSKLGDSIRWRIGALFALLTVVVYVVQIVLGSLRKGEPEPQVGSSGVPNTRRASR